MRKLHRRYGRAHKRDLWTVDYRAIWKTGSGLWRIALVRALTATDAVAALTKLEKRQDPGLSHLSKIKVTEGNDVPGYQDSRIIDARNIL